MRDWKTAAFGALAIVVAVGAGVLEHFGYSAPPAVVDAILGLLVGGGLFVAKDSK